MLFRSGATAGNCAPPVSAALLVGWLALRRRRRKAAAIFAVASQIARVFHSNGSDQPIGTPQKANQNGEPQWPMKAKWDLHRSGGLKPCLPVLLAALAQAKCHLNGSAGRGAVQDGAVDA